MIITCNNCSKKFSVNSNVIPEKGRLLQCNGCNNKWFFKKEITNEPITTDIENINHEKTEPIKIDNTDNQEFFDNQNENDFSLGKIEKLEAVDTNADIPKVKKNYNIFGLIVVIIITFIALILVLDTFQNPLSKVFPKIEFLLYNLYETIKDIGLFLKDLI
jgi:predicted Zn finger-like uncharacterized protein